MIAVAVPQQHANLTYLDLQDSMQTAVTFIREQEAGKQAIIVQEHENAYEYPAIHSLYRMAMSKPDDAARNHLFLYFHTKGMVNHGVIKERVEKRLFDATIVPWRGIAQQFIENSSIRAAGWMPSSVGFVWYNFWWVRGSYMKQLPEPKRDVQRHWLESWIGMGPEEVRKATKVLSTCTCNFSFVGAKRIRKAKKKCKKVTPSICMP